MARIITTFFWSQTFAFWPNSRLKTPIVPGPQTSCVIKMSAFTQTFSPAETFALPAALAKIFSVKVINTDGQCSSRASEGQADEFGKTALRSRRPASQRSIHEVP